MKRMLWTLCVLALMSSSYSQNSTTEDIINLGNEGFFNDSTTAGFEFLGCTVTNPKIISCNLTISLKGNKDDLLRIRKNDYTLIFKDGSIYFPSSFSMNAYKNGQESTDNFDFPGSLGIEYKLTIKFAGISSKVQDLTFLDVGNKQASHKWMRVKDIVVKSSATLLPPPTPLPIPQPALTPKQYLTFNATNGYGSLSGVSLNGGLYDVNLQRCRPVDNGMAACTLTLAPMRATAQDVTLEDLNVSVNGTAVTATATAMPTVMTLIVTAPVNVNRIDELRLGNARFLNVGVK